MKELLFWLEEVEMTSYDAFKENKSNTDSDKKNTAELVH